MTIEKWKNILEKYSYAPRKDIYNRITRKGLIALPEDYDIINSILLWKLNRQVSIAHEDIEYLNSIANNINTPKKLRSKQDEFISFMNAIVKNSKGIGLAMTSTILHFYQPNVFPIIDKRAYRQVFDTNLPVNSGASEYLNYCFKCFDICEKHKIPIGDIDKVLYQLDKERGYNVDEKVRSLKVIIFDISDVLRKNNIDLTGDTLHQMFGLIQIDSLDDDYYFDSGTNLLVRFITALEKLEISDLDKYIEELDKKGKKYLDSV